MKHYGDITKIHGDEIPAVDVITGGSPCQDLSVAGKRAGLQGERSGLFMDQMRIVKEMRERDRRAGRTGESIRPRYMVWENVDGARSSPGGEHKGEDFAAVIEECIKVCDPDAAVRIDVPDGGWPKSGCYFDNQGNWSLAWRLHDAQYFGVAQRRRRICLLVDFAGLTAPEILFDIKFGRTTEDGEPCETLTDTGSESASAVSALSEGLPGDTRQSGTEGQGSAAGITGGAGEPGGCLNPWNVQSKHIQPEDGIAEALYSGECRGGGGESYTLKVRGGADVDSSGKRAGKGALVQTEMSGTLGVSQDQTLFAFAQNQREEVRDLGGVAGSCAAETGIHQQTFLSVPIEGNGARPSHFGNGYGAPGDPSFTLNTTEVHGVAYGVVSKGNGEAFLTEEQHMTIGVGGGQAGQGYPCVYGISAYDSNAMKSPNPHSGVYEADTSRTLDNNGGSPACNQGGGGGTLPGRGLPQRNGGRGE